MRRSKSFFVLSLLVSFFLSVNAFGKDFSVASPRPANWAVPLEIRGLANLHRVDATLYRGAQPDETSGEALKALGIKTVLNLRKHDKDKPLHSTPGIHFMRYPLHTWDIDDRDIIAVLKIITKPDNQPVMVHCAHGADRTGLMMASYRIIVQGWTKEAAIDEMRNGGYEYHAIWKNIIRRINKMDAAKLRAEIYATE
jgi:protein tyrosine/serine phosphatase